ncbi:hypothetical protein ABB37_08865 [Leptomonas pyrrhocoris]|uniref:Conserved oligomeric Golgi complex subunit 1 n=1 Tax=Leptomonas pyrrhocoris TaxID=157538 RepID=A0A0N0DRR4_LEPPY|nr:hypothetical protein ABB37_08865 [Leptomonas pyrrhocoris]KPA74848.1 hypothetical protein ABB37_08865 [Leptomonas pyrrhocoris]|eukprot:XP_015653287.1 hypothetical protein ABB37_08865 [Leptomonas pyrrhocoris]
MSVEEAAQEVRRILRLNDIEETLHYLSTVTRSIEANQHDLRAAIGSSYRDLLAACDGVVGMEKDCQDILTIEAALEGHTTQQSANTARSTTTTVTPLLPPAWFAKRQNRRRPAAATTTGNAASSTRGKSTRESTPLLSTLSQSKAAGKSVQQEVATAELPKVVLPLCLSATHNVPTREASQAPSACERREGEDEGNEKATDAPTASHEDRMRLDDELQALHQQYMTAATTVKSPGGAAADVRFVFAMLADSGSTEAPHRENGGGSKKNAATAAISLSGLSESATQMSASAGFPLQSVAQRLQRVRDALALLRKSPPPSHPASAVVSAAPTSATSGTRRSGQTPAWVISFQRRANTLETRLVKLLLARLRRAADAYAQLVEQRAHLEQRARRWATSASMLLSTTVDAVEAGRAALRPSTQRSTATAVDTEREKNSLESRRRALQADAERCAVYLCAVLAECHGVLRALCTSPTLLGALVACAPGVDLPRSTEGDTSTSAEDADGHLFGTASLEKSADSLFFIASLKTREVVTAILFDGGAPLASQDQPHPQERHAQEEARSADPARWLLALVSVLLLREAQVSAARWSTTLLSAGTVAALPHTNDGKADTAAGTNGSIHHDVQSTCPAAALSEYVSSSSCTARTQVFANSALLSALGLSSSVFPSSPSGPAASTRAAINSARTEAAFAGMPSLVMSAGPAAGVELSNTAWALRCFSGLPFLLRGLADYIDLSKPSVAAAASSVPPEVRVLNFLRRVCRENEALGNITDISGGWSMFSGVHADGGGVTVQRGGGGGAHSLEELLAWRLKGPGGLARDPTADAAGTPCDARSFTLNSPLAAAFDNPTSPPGPPSPWNREPNTPSPTIPPAAAAKTTPGKQLSSLHAMSQYGATLPAATRCRVCVAALRASLDTVTELNVAGAARTTRLAASSQQTSNNSAAAAVPPRPADVALLPSTTLEYAARELLVPLISSLVMGLARDPVAMAEFGAYAAQQDTRAASEGESTEASALPASSSSSLAAVLLAGGSQEGRTVPGLGATSVGTTWKRITSQLNLAQTRRTALHAALQRCFTVALHSVSFVEDCLVRGLIGSTRSLAVLDGERNEKNITEEAAVVGEEANRRHDKTSPVAGTAWSLEQLQQTWAALSDVMRRHTLHLAHTDSVPRSADDAAATTLEHKPHKSRGGTTADDTMFNGSSIARGSSGRVGFASSAAGIDWHRFRSSAAVTASAAGGGGGLLNGARRGTQPGNTEQGANSATCRGAGDGPFREEVLQWGQAALQAADVLSFLAQSGEGVAKGEAAVLSRAQQQEVMTVLGGFGRRLFPQWRAPLPASPGEEAAAAASFAQKDKSEDFESDGAMTGGIALNGHAAELLHRCLQTLVAAVAAFGASATSNDDPRSHHADGVASLGSEDGSSSSSASLDTLLYSRVVRWLANSLARIEAQLRYLPRTSSPALPTPAEVVHGYEASLVLRVYHSVLRQLVTTALPPGSAAAAGGEVRRLCERTAELYRTTNSLWQEVLLRYYTDALRHHYDVQPHMEDNSSDGGGGKQAYKSPRRLTGLVDPSSWIRATITGDTPTPSTLTPSAAVTTASSNGRHHSSRGVSYPAVPTPALTAVVQRTLRLLHHALYGRATVYSSDDDGLLVGGGAANGVDGGRGSEAAGGPDTVGAVFGTPCGCVTHQLVSPQERQHVLHQLSHVTADLFEQELLPLLSASSSSFASAADATTTTTSITARDSGGASGSSSDADDVRLQWLMDVLFLSSVWATSPTDNSHHSSEKNGSHDGGASLFDTAPSNANTFPSNGGADLTRYVAAGPLRRIAVLLETSCDRLRWRSAVPLVMTAYRQFLSASAALWVARAEHDAEEVVGFDETNRGAPRDAGGADRRNGDEITVASVALAAAMRPLVVDYPDVTGGGLVSPTERLLQPRERVERLALLPIAVSNAAVVAAAAAAGATGNAGVGSMNPAAYTIPPPTAASLNPYQALSPVASTSIMSTSASAAGGLTAAGGLSYRMSGPGALPPYMGPAGGSMFYEGASGAGGVGAGGESGRGSAAMRGAAGAGASSAAAAASSLWDTTQRGWSQLWGGRTE